MRLLITSLVLALLLCIPFFIWGDEFLRWFTGDAAIEWIRGCGAWGWLGAIGLIVSDLVLPIPATAVMSATGYLYGAFVGGLISAGGSFAAGMLGYGLCRVFGRGIAARLAGEKEMEDHHTLFQRSGPWLVAASRWLPVLPEVIACLAGLTRMPLRFFAAALACGSVPMGFVYAAIGAAGQDRPRLAIGLSVLVPLLLWAVVRSLLQRRVQPCAERRISG
ncbi:MAG: VTT domain-containing protein [Chthoniobacteraceae bacterium]